MVAESLLALLALAPLAVAGGAPAQADGAPARAESAPAQDDGAAVAADDAAVWIGSRGQVRATAASAQRLFTGKTLSLELVKADLHSTMRLMSEVGGFDVVVGDDVQGEVSIRLVDVPWDAALAAILELEGLVAVPVAGPGGRQRWVVRAKG